LDLESNSVKEDVLTETSSSSQYPLFSTVCDTSTCNGGTPCYLSLYYDELTSQLAQVGEIIHDANENNQIFEQSSQPSSSLHLHEEKSSNQLAHENSLICLSLNS